MAQEVFQSAHKLADAQTQVFTLQKQVADLQAQVELLRRDVTRLMESRKKPPGEPWQVDMGTTQVR